MPIYGGRIRTDRRADALRAARRVLDEGVTLRDAQRGFGIGRTYLKEAIAQLRGDRAAAAAAPCDRSSDQVHSKHRHQRDAGSPAPVCPHGNMPREAGAGHWRDWHRGHGCHLDPEVQ